MCSIKADEYEVVKRELQRRGAWAHVAQAIKTGNASVTCGKYPDLFYVQPSPPLACWAVYDDRDEWRESMRRISTANVQSGDKLIFTQYGSSGESVGEFKSTEEFRALPDK